MPTTQPARVSRVPLPIRQTLPVYPAGTGWKRVNIDTQPVRLAEIPDLQLAPPIPASNRWGIVLAGGNGVRLRGLTQARWGPDRPKQFCPLLGRATLLEETRRRAERSIPAGQILFSLIRAHSRYYLSTLGDRPSQRIVQPCNRGTAPAIIYPLVRIARRDPDAVVTIFPSDHYYSSESAFSDALETAVENAESHPQSVILLGARADRAETEFGWIKPGARVNSHTTQLFRVEGFQEKPSPDEAEHLRRSGCLWNTFVMVGHVNAFLKMASAVLPRLTHLLETMEVTTHGSGEVQLSPLVYNQIPTLCYSRHVLANSAEKLLVLRLENLNRSDLGSPYRVLATLVEKNGSLPEWAKGWPGFEPAPRVATAGGSFSY